MYCLTIAVPIFNMEWCLEKNLSTYDDPRLAGKVEVICLNNASEDGSKAIVEKFVAARPEIFRLMDRDSRGYGSSINAALDAAKGRYFRIVDADDWVDTEDLVKLTAALEDCRADVVQTDYEIVDMQTGAMTPVRAGDKGAAYGVSPGSNCRTTPSMWTRNMSCSPCSAPGRSCSLIWISIDIWWPIPARAHPPATAPSGRTIRSG